MAIEITKWKCEHCGKMFTHYRECVKHEELCNKCNQCSNAYYVYGCEWNCKYYEEGKCDAKIGVYYETKENDKHDAESCG